MRALARVAAAALLVTAGCHNDNTVTGPASLPTPTPVPATPTPSFTALTGHVTAHTNGVYGYHAAPGAVVSLWEGPLRGTATSASDGSYTITGLVPGSATVLAVSPVPFDPTDRTHCSSGDVVVILKPGMNVQDLVMECVFH